MTSKTMYMETARGASGHEIPFAKPYFQSIVMFIAMFLVFIPHYIDNVLCCVVNS